MFFGRQNRALWLVCLRRIPTCLIKTGESLRFWGGALCLKIGKFWGGAASGDSLRVLCKLSRWKRSLGSHCAPSVILKNRKILGRHASGDPCSLGSHCAPMLNMLVPRMPRIFLFFDVTVKFSEIWISRSPQKGSQKPPQILIRSRQNILQKQINPDFKAQEPRLKEFSGEND